MMKKVLVAGSLNMDMVTNVERIPVVGETLLGSEIEMIPGGKGANQAVAIGKLGGRVYMVGAIGNDEYGEHLLTNLKQNNVESNQVSVLEGYNTGLAFIMVNSCADNSIVVIPGANGAFEEKLIDEKKIREADIILAQMEIPIETVEYVFKKGREYNKYIILNPAPARKIPDRMMALIDLVVPNETEFEILTGYSAKSEESLLKGVQKLFGRGVKEVIVTLGERGARYFSRPGDDIYVPGKKVKAVDTTAAGDSFIGAYVTAISDGEGIEKALNFAAKAAAITVSRPGAQQSLPGLKMVNAF